MATDVTPDWSRPIWRDGRWGDRAGVAPGRRPQLSPERAGRREPPPRKDSTNSGLADSSAGVPSIRTSPPPSTYVRSETASGAAVLLKQRRRDHGREVGGRLVEQEDAGIEHQHPAHGEHLPLAAAQL